MGMKLIDWSKMNYNQFKKERRNSLDKFPKTKKPENVKGKRDEEPPEKKKLSEKVDNY